MQTINADYNCQKPIKNLDNEGVDVLAAAGCFFFPTNDIQGKQTETIFKFWMQEDTHMIQYVYIYIYVCCSSTM